MKHFRRPIDREMDILRGELNHVPNERELRNLARINLENRRVRLERQEKINQRQGWQNRPFDSLFNGQ